MTNPGDVPRAMDRIVPGSSLAIVSSAPTAQSLLERRSAACADKRDLSTTAVVRRPSGTPTIFSLYDMAVISEAQIQEWADEAEVGYDVEELKRRGRGRPGRGAEPMQVVAVRLTAEELDALDRAAAERQMSRSEVIRAALTQFAA